jgi:hypothetical protein
MWPYVFLFIIGGLQMNQCMADLHIKYVVGSATF